MRGCEPAPMSVNQWICGRRAPGLFSEPFLSLSPSLVGRLCPSSLLSPPFLPSLPESSIGKSFRVGSARSSLSPEQEAKQLEKRVRRIRKRLAKVGRRGEREGGRGGRQKSFDRNTLSNGIAWLRFLLYPSILSPPSRLLPPPFPSSSSRSR